MKKISVVLLLAVLVFGMTACGGEKEQPQAIQQKEEQQEQSEKIKRLEEEKNGPFKIVTDEKEMLEKFPELQQIEDYLFANYSTLNREIQAKAKDKETKPIAFLYAAGEGKPIQMTLMLNFNESATKREMIDAIKYVSKEVSNLFPDEVDVKFWFEANIDFTDNGNIIENSRLKRGKIKLTYSKENPELVWKEETKVDIWGTFNPDEVKPDEVVAYFEEEKPQEETPAVEEKTSGITIDEIIGIMEASQEYDEINMKEFSREKEETTGHVISKGGNEEGSYTFEITANGEEQSISGIYKVKRLAEMSDEDFKTECMKYLKRSAFSQYASAEGLATYRYVNEAVKYVIGSNGLEKEFIIQNTRFEIISEEEGNCIAMYVTNYVE